MNILEDMQTEQIRADAVERLSDAPAQIAQRYKFARAGAIGAGALLAVSILAGQSWIGALLPLFAPGLALVRELKKYEKHAAEALWEQKHAKYGNMLLLTLVALKYALFYTPAYLLAWFFVAQDFRMPALAELLQYVVESGAVYYGLTRMRLFSHTISAVDLQREQIGGGRAAVIKKNTILTNMGFVALAAAAMAAGVRVYYTQAAGANTAHIVNTYRYYVKAAGTAAGVTHRMPKLPPVQFADGVTIHAAFNSRAHPTAACVTLDMSALVQQHFYYYKLRPIQKVLHRYNIAAGKTQTRVVYNQYSYTPGVYNRNAKMAGYTSACLAVH